MKRQTYAVILAGGSGTRFWPLSRRSHPKQFLQLLGPQTLLDLTIERLLPVIPARNILVVTGKDYAKTVRRALRRYRIPVSQVLLEPRGKNTAPAVAWAARWIEEKDPDAVMAVMPSDHIIGNAPAFRKVFRQAVRAARHDVLVTFGIPPTRPETGYGYLKVKRTKGSPVGTSALDRFVEKPDAARAKRFLRDKRYLWNSGMFVWRADVILDAFRRHCPQAIRPLSSINQRHINRHWKAMPNISIDYGVLEKAGNVVAVAAKGIGWSDLGSWQSAYEFSAKDGNGNACFGKTLVIGARKNLIHSSGRLIAVAGTENLAVIETPDAVLVCPLGQSQAVKQLVAALQSKNRALT